jgi:hypothetical protein
MSTEQILLLVAFFIVSLVQWLVGAARERKVRQPEQAGSQTPFARPLPTRQPPSGANAPLRRVPAVAPVSAPEPESVSDTVVAGEATPRGEPAPSVTPAPTSSHNARGRAAVLDLRNPTDLRRAVVLMTILGPCRATNPHEWPEHGGSR